MKSRSRHPNRSSRPGRPARPSKSHKTERSERSDRPARAVRPDRPSGPDRSERSQRSEHRKPERSDYRNKKPAFSARPETSKPRVERPEKVEAPAAPQLPTNVQTVIVTADENGMRVDRFFESRFPGLSFSHIQRIIRKGEVRVNGKRAQPKGRLEEGQSIRIPPLRLDAPRPGADSPAEHKDRAFIKSITLFEDDDVMVLNKPMGLAVQGGSGTVRHIDGMLGAIRSRDGQRPRLVHRLDKDTAGCLLVAKNRFSAAALAKNFRSRSARKIYWALVPGVPKPKQGRISTYLAKEEREDDSIMRRRRTWRRGCEPRDHFLCRGRDRGAKTRLALAQAGHRAYSSIACADGAYRSPAGR